MSAEPDYRPFPDVARRNLMQETIELPLMALALRLPKGGRVLEVGCGRGIALPPLARLLAPQRLVGVDIDAGLVALARERVQAADAAASVEVADVRKLPFADGEFSLVIDFGTCHHIARPAEAIREIVRVLEPGGLFACETVTSQLLSHPFRTRGRRLPWRAAPELHTLRDRILWKVRRRN